MTFGLFHVVALVIAVAVAIWAVLVLVELARIRRVLVVEQMEPLRVAGPELPELTDEEAERIRQRFLKAVHDGRGESTR